MNSSKRLRDVISALTGKGAQVDMPRNLIPFHIAAYNGHRYTLEAMHNHFIAISTRETRRPQASLLDKLDGSAFAAIHYAAMSDSSYDVLDYLINKKANVNIHGPQLKTPLHFACDLGLSNFVVRLMHSPGIELNYTDSSGNTCVNLAEHPSSIMESLPKESEERTALIKLLIEAGAKPAKWKK
jgi:ankyrin repeat protein